jgi:hypothetical protein
MAAFDVRETGGVIGARTTDQADTVAVLVGHDPPAVVLLLVDPPGSVEGLGSEFGLHRDKGGGEGHPYKYRPPTTEELAGTRVAAPPRRKVRPLTAEDEASCWRPSGPLAHANGWEYIPD